MHFAFCFYCLAYVRGKLLKFFDHIARILDSVLTKLDVAVVIVQ